jgi:hypothetical protein
MSFVQIGFLAALGGLAIPIIIHLVFRQRPKRVELGTLRFLRIVLEHNARRRRVMRWLLLALRLACVALLAFLFARPYLLEARQGGEKTTVVVLIDQSATMELKADGARAIERAVASTKDLLASANDNSRFEIAFFDHAVHPLVEGAADEKKDARRRDLSADELASKLKAPAACYGATDYGGAMEWARDILAKAPPGPRRLHVFTDFQRSGLAWSEVDSLPENVATELHDLGKAAVNNIAITEARPERSWLRPEEQTSLHVTIYNGGPFPANELTITLKLTSQSRKIELKEQAKLESGALASIRFDLPPLAEGEWRGAVSVESEDDLPLDNSRPIALLASRAYQVLLVDGKQADSAVTASTYFLEAALRLAPPGELYPASPFEPRRIGPAESLPNLEKFDAVVLSNVGDLSKRDAQKISDLVKRGGGLLVFCGENVTAENTKELEAAGLMAGKLEKISRVTDLPWRLKSWDSKHPIFAAFSDPQLGDLQRLSFSAHADIAPAKDGVVLASFSDGKPAVVEKKIGKGTAIWFTSTCDREWSDAARSRLYLPLMYQFLGYQTGLTAGGKMRQEILEGNVSEKTPAEPGVHALDGYTLVVGESPRESETERCTSEEFATRFGLKLADATAAVEGPKEEQAAAGTELMDSEIWPWLASLLLAAVVIEGLVANRTAA